MDSYTAACFDCRYPLDGLASTDCPECGRSFDPDDVATFNRVLSDPAELVRLPIARAIGLRLKLEHEGIPVAMQEQTGGVIMYAPLPMAALYVNRSDLEHARQFMALFAESDRPIDEDGSEWNCSNCDEQIDGQFDACWNCGSERDANTG